MSTMVVPFQRLLPLLERSNGNFVLALDTDAVSIIPLYEPLNPVTALCLWYSLD